MRTITILAILFLLSLSVPAIPSSGAKVSYGLAFTMSFRVDPATNASYLNFTNFGTRPIASAGLYLSGGDAAAAWESAIQSPSIPPGGSVSLEAPCQNVKGYAPCTFSNTSQFSFQVSTKPTKSGGYFQLGLLGLVTADNLTHGFRSYPAIALSQFTSVYPRSWNVKVNNIGTITAEQVYSEIDWKCSNGSPGCSGSLATAEHTLLPGQGFSNQGVPIRILNPASTHAEVCAYGSYQLFSSWVAFFSNCQVVPVL